MRKKEAFDLAEMTNPKVPPSLADQANHETGSSLLPEIITFRRRCLLQVARVGMIVS